MDKDIKLVKLKVCASCQSPEILYNDCICTYSNNYPIIELEFEQCNCCGRTAPHPAETSFNEEQFLKFEKKNNG